ncbi:MAG: hypothetical protein ACXVC6_14885 [Bacteroidia bacterium]
MKDANDTTTTELFPVPKKRGRPSTGTAKSGAERQAAYRRNKRKDGERGKKNLNLWISTEAKFSLQRLARHLNQTPEQVLSDLLQAEEKRITKDWPDCSEENEHYFRFFE